MSRTEELTAIVERDGDAYVALFPELDIASQGATVDEARANLKEAIELFFETADASEIDRRLSSERYVSRLHVERA
jgi:predicted RNase H-like HicB family nuclease